MLVCFDCARERSPREWKEFDGQSSTLDARLLAFWLGRQVVWRSAGYWEWADVRLDVEVGIERLKFVDRIAELLEIYETVLPVGRKELEMEGGVVCAGMESLYAMSMVESFEMRKKAWWVDMATLGVLVRAVEELERNPVKAMKWLLKDAKTQLVRTEKLWERVLSGRSICGLRVSRRKKLLEAQIRELEYELDRLDPNRGTWSAWLADMIEDGQRRHWRLSLPDIN